MTQAAVVKNIKRSLLELYGQELVAICVLGHDGLFSDKMLMLYYLLFFFISVPYNSSCCRTI